MGSALCAALLSPAARAQTIDPPDNPSYHVMIPAGPVSTLNTMSGVLNTSVPIVSLKGKGRTSLDFSITHHSRASEPATPNHKRQVARGWEHNYNSFIRSSVYYVPSYIGPDHVTWEVPRRALVGQHVWTQRHLGGQQRQDSPVRHPR